MISVRFLLLYVLMLSFLISHSQKVDIQDTEVNVLYEGDSLFFFDYRLHRNPALILKEIRQERPGLNPIHLYRGSVIYHNDSLSNSVGNIAFTPSTIFPYRLDLQLKPFYYAEYGRFDNPVRTQIGIAPRFELSVWKGFYGVFQWVFPIQNDFKGRFGYKTRPGELGVGYSRVISRQHHFNAFAGTFINDRYGLYGEYVWRNRSGRVYAGISGFYTGKFLYQDQVLTRDPYSNFKFTGTLYGAYRFVKHDITVRLLGERFIRGAREGQQDLGVTMQLFRQFGSTDIGFYATRSRDGDNAGFFVTFALWPRKFLANRFVQIRPPSSFRFAYNLRPNTGIAFGTRPYTDFFFDIYRFNPYFIQRQLDK